MKKLLIAYDGSPGAEIAVKDLLRAGLPDRAEAKVLTIADVWVPPRAVASESVYPEYKSLAAVYEKATELLREAKKTAIQGAQLVHELFPHWTVCNAAKAESPAWGIMAEARRWRADLVVIGSHGRTPLEKFFLGSVSHKVAAEACCSVRVVRPRVRLTDHPARILIGLDGSDYSQRAAEEVLQRRWNPATHVDLVTVIDSSLKSRVLGLEATREKFTRQGLSVQCHIFEGDPKRTLLHYAADWNVDCIFLGARGSEHGQRLYLGTLASAVCTRAHCTVEIVRAVA